MKHILYIDSFDNTLAFPFHFLKAVRLLFQTWFKIQISRQMDEWTGQNQMHWLLLFFLSYVANKKTLILSSNCEPKCIEIPKLLTCIKCNAWWRYCCIGTTFCGPNSWKCTLFGDMIKTVAPTCRCDRTGYKTVMMRSWCKFWEKFTDVCVTLKGYVAFVLHARCNILE